MNVQRYETEIGRVPQRAPWRPIPWREEDYDGSERPLDRDVEEQPRKPARNDRSRRPRAAKTPVFWC
jgi:hypothetical protein